MAQRIKMVHPNFGDDQIPARTDMSAFEKIWAIKGWEIYEEPVVVVVAAPPPVEVPAETPEDPEAAPEDDEQLADSFDEDYGNFSDD